MYAVYQWLCLTKDNQTSNLLTSSPSHILNAMCSEKHRYHLSHVLIHTMICSTFFFRKQFLLGHCARNVVNTSQWQLQIQKCFEFQLFWGMWCHVAGQGAPDVCKVCSAFSGSSSPRWKPMQDKKYVLHRWVVDGWSVWQANRRRCWDRLCSAGMERRSKHWRKANKQRTLKEACQPPNTCINGTYTIHILSYMTVPPWLLDPEMKAIHSLQMSQLLFHQHGIYYIAENQPCCMCIW